MKLHANITEKSLIVENVQADQANKIIDGFFQVLGITPKTKKIETATTKIGETEHKTALVDSGTSKTTLVPKIEVFGTVSPENASKSAENIAKSVQNPPKVLPKINDDRTLSVSIGELIKQEQGRQSVRELPDGTKIYQAHYWCTCGNEGNRFIPPTNNYLKCHECDAKLLVEPATFEVDANNLPEQDKFGNYFVARHEYEY